MVDFGEEAFSVESVIMLKARLRIGVCVAVCCSVLQGVAVCCRVLQCVAVILQCVAGELSFDMFKFRSKFGDRCVASILQSVAVCCSVLLFVTSVLQCVASVLRCVAVWCS